VLLPGLCLSLVLALVEAPAPPVFVAVERFTLAWTHSIEKARWEEDYSLTVTPAGPALEALESRIKGSAAGMEPPPDAQWVNGWYAYRPALRHLNELRLTRSAYTADYELCTTAGCQPLSTWLGPAQGGTVLVRPCTNIRQRPASGSSD